MICVHCGTFDCHYWEWWCSLNLVGSDPDAAQCKVTWDWAVQTWGSALCAEGTEQTVGQEHSGGFNYVPRLFDTPLQR